MGSSVVQTILTFERIAADVEIKSYKDVITALLKRADYFNEIGCRISDQAFDYVPFKISADDEIEAVFVRAMNGEKLTQSD